MKTILKILILSIFVIPTPLSAGTYPEIDVEKLFAKKKELIKESMQLSEKESAVFLGLV